MKILIATDCCLFSAGGLTASVPALCAGLHRLGHEVSEKLAPENPANAALIVRGVNREISGLAASGEADVTVTEIMEAGCYAGQDERLAAPIICEPFTLGQLGALMPKGSGGLPA